MRMLGGYKLRDPLCYRHKRPQGGKITQSDRLTLGTKGRKAPLNRLGKRPTVCLMQYFGPVMETGELRPRSNPRAQFAPFVVAIR